MAIRRNALSTSSVGRFGRAFHRRYTRPLAREAVLATRRARHNRWAHSPDFLVVGVQKGGTTALFDGLTGSDRIGTPLVKEVHYFDRYPDRSLGWYRSHFWGATPGLVWGESTPAYFDTPDIPARVASALPDVKIVITLRDPLARAISHYFHAVHFQLETRPLAQALADEIALLQDGGWRTLDDFHERGYLGRSRYSTAVRRWFDVFPSEQIKVVVAERRAESLVEVGQFLVPDVNEDWTVRESNVRPYQMPTGVNLTAAVDLLRADCAELQTVLGCPSVPAEWTSLRT